jgi:hypothetical protein
MYSLKYLFSPYDLTAPLTSSCGLSTRTLESTIRLVLFRTTPMNKEVSSEINGWIVFLYHILLYALYLLSRRVMSYDLVHLLPLHPVYTLNNLTVLESSYSYSPFVFSFCVLFVFRLLL